MSRKLDVGFGERLKKAAEKAGVAYSQTPIADFLKVRRQNVDAWMKGSLPRANDLFAIADKFNVDPRWLASGQIKPESQNQNDPTGNKYSELIHDREIVSKLLELIVAYLDTDDEGREELNAAASAVAGDNGTTRAHKGRRSGRR